MIEIFDFSINFYLKKENKLKHETAIFLKDP